MSSWRTAAPQARPVRRLAPVVAAASALLLVGTLAVVLDGYDAREVPQLDTGVWVTRDAGQYARVNTDLAEIDTVRSVADPTLAVQSGSTAVVFSQGFRQAWAIDAANPRDLAVSDQPSDAGADDSDVGDQDVVDGPHDEGEAADTDDEASVRPVTGVQNTPPGTRELLSAGDYLVYLTETGSVYLSALRGQNGQAASAFPLNPFASVVVEEGEDPPVYVADAVALSPSGRVVLYSKAEAATRTYDAVAREFLGEQSVVVNPPAADAALQLSLVGDTWVLGSPGDGLLWIEGRAQPVKTGLGGDAVMQPFAREGRVVHVADSRSLVAVSVDSGEVSQLASADGVPAVPVEVDGVVFAGWVGSSAGSLWSSASGDRVPLVVDEALLEQAPVVAPVFYHNGRRAVLAEQSTGMLWRAPDGVAIPTDQWTLGEDDPDSGTVEVDDMAQQEPPVAVADAFGVRSGSLVLLPLLLNDHDPNKKDVLSIDPESLTDGLGDPGFGELGLVGNDQQVAVRVAATSGSSSFMYSVTDGAARSASVPVVLTVVPDGVNSAPVWCPVEGCVQEWPSPQLAAGGTISVPVLDGWVDPEGDPIVLADVRKANPSDPVTVVPTADGSVAIRHSDPNASGLALVLTVVVTDSFGAVAEKELELTIGPSPAIKASPVAVTSAPNEKVSVRIADHVLGGSGAYRVVDAVESSASAEGLIVVPNAAAGTIELSASAAGSYVVTYTVQDAVTLAEQSAIIRLTAVGASRPVTIAPLTAFVRANEDTTVDVLGAVQNTTGRVLVVTDAMSSTPSLSVDVVAQSRIRVSGSTRDGSPGLIGTASVTVMDGSGLAVRGEISVFLVAASTSVAPIAMPDAVSVRAGTQVDIPVLANDVSPRGERLVVHPLIEGSGAAGELAFVGANSVRYLAPSVPGVYTLRYSAYLESRPDRVDSATITVTVLAPGANRAPQPPVLSARAQAGQTVSIPVAGFGMDPDGDRVVLTGVEVPPAGFGVPSVSPDGRSIVYSAPAAGVPGGQASFEYSVRDAFGASASGRVLVGVVSGDLADRSPVTYSDYVQTRLGSSTPVRVAPLLNDRDPAQGELTIIGLRPNAPGDSSNPEYARLEALIDPTTSLESGEVVLRAGDVLGTHSFVYTVQSSVTTSTTEGLIVVDVAESAAPDVPVVSDTVLMAKDRALLSSGVDVVTGKVRWISGDVSGLTLSLWGSAAERYSVSGWRIAGDLPTEGDLVPFTLSGADSLGGEVVVHGFLRIPAFEDMRVQLNPVTVRIEVDEEKSVEFDVRDVLDLDRADVVELDSDTDFVVQRENASCDFVSGTTARYSTGREAPWVDACTVRVRLAGQSAWSTVSVPVWIRPKDPQAILSTIARTLVPGESATINLYETLTTWEGGRVGEVSLLDYSTQFNGTSFVVTQLGDTISIETRADAVPGTRESVGVGVSNFGGLVGGVTLVVGIAPPDAPRGATFSQQCDVSRGASCAITVVGVAGEYDPFEGKLGGGLTVVGVGTGTSLACPVATVSVSGESQVVATWPAGPRPVGGECIVPLTVADAQGRTGPGEVRIDVLGYPQTPASVFTTNYSATSVTLTVPLGEAAGAHPAVTSVVIDEGGVPFTGSVCSPSGPANYTCVVSGLENGTPHTFTARAINSVGDSLPTTEHTTWSYREPVVTALSGVTIFDVDRTSTTHGAVDLSITAADDTMSFRVVNTGEVFPRTGPTTTARVSLQTGPVTVDVVPISQFRPPINSTGDHGEGRQAAVTVNSIGLPLYSAHGTATGSPDSGNVTLSGTILDANGGTKGSEVFVAWAQDAQTPTCSVSGGAISVSGGSSGAGSTITMPIDGIYYIKACAMNDFGLAESVPQAADTIPVPSAPTGDLTFRVAATGPHAPGVFAFGMTKEPTVAAVPNWNTVFTDADNDQPHSFQLSNGSMDYSVRYCRVVLGATRCSEPSAIGPESGSAPSTALVEFRTDASLSKAEAAGGAGVAVHGAAAMNHTILFDDIGDNKIRYRLQFTNAYSPLGVIEFDVSYQPPGPPDPPDPPSDP